MSDLEFGLEVMSKMFGIFKVLGVLGVGLTAFGIYMIVSRSKSKHNNEPTVDGSPRKNYKKFPIVGIVLAMWFGISWMISGLVGAVLGSTMNSPYFKERLQEEVAKGNVTVTVNGEQVPVATPTPEPTKEPVATPTLTPTATPIAETPVPTEAAKPTDMPKQTETDTNVDVSDKELFEATLKFGIHGETLTLKFPKEWEEDAYVSEDMVTINYFEDIKVDYTCCFYKKGQSDWIEDKMEMWSKIYDISEFAFANELELEGASDTCYIFGWDTTYGTKKIQVYIAGSLDYYLEISISDYSNMTWDEWREAINLFVVTF